MLQQTRVGFLNCHSERGVAKPTLSTLHLIATSLNVGLPSLLLYMDADPNPKDVVERIQTLLKILSKQIRL